MATKKLAEDRKQILKTKFPNFISLSSRIDGARFSCNFSFSRSSQKEKYRESKTDDPMPGGNVTRQLLNMLEVSL
jgi:hypothetical protein